MIIMFLGTASTIFILPPSAIIREDGTLVKVEAASSVRKELQNFIKVVKDKRILLLSPMFFASNYFYAYQGAINAFYFDGATRKDPSTLTYTRAQTNPVFRRTEWDVGGCWRHRWSADDRLLRP